MSSDEEKEQHETQTEQKARASRAFASLWADSRAQWLGMGQATTAANDNWAARQGDRAGGVSAPETLGDTDRLSPPEPEDA